MTFVRKYRVTAHNPTDRRYHHWMCTLLCDVCGENFEKRFKKRELTRMHSCSPECNRLSRRKGGALAKKIEKINLEKWGCVSTAQHPDVKKTARETCEELYGGPSSMSSPEIVARQEASMIAAHGVRNSMQLESVREKSRQTMIDRYGADHPMRSEEIKEKLIGMD